MNPGMTSSEYAALQESAKALHVSVQSLVPPSPVAPSPVATSSTLQLALKDVAVLSREELIRKYGSTIADKAIELTKSQPLTAQQAFSEYQRAERAAKAKLGSDLRATGKQVHLHSENEYTQVIVKQLDLQLEGVNPSVDALLHAVFPDDPKKATSIGNSTRKDRRKKAFNSEAVRNHPIEVAMQFTHGKGSMNQRCSTGTFRQSLGIGRTLFKSCDRITKLEARVQLLEQQMESTKNREALADAGYTTPKEMVLSRHAAGIGPSGIAKELEMEVERVRSIIYRSKKPSRK
jgi:hypothetical protein